MDVHLADGRVAGVQPATTGRDLSGDVGSPGEHVDLHGRLLLPALVEPHAHLDKALLSIPGTGPGLMAAVRAWVERYPERTVPEITERAIRAAREYAAHGVGAIRTHADVGPRIGTRAIEASLSLAAAVQELVDVQVVAFVASPYSGTDGAPARAAARAAIEAGAHVLGGAPWLDPDPAAAVDVLLDLAVEHGLAVDLHVDETLAANADTISLLAQAVGAGFPHAVTASHVVSLGGWSAARQEAVAARLAQKGIGVVTLPRTNLWLQERERRSGARRGLTAVRALLDAGVTVAAGTDNLRDVFNPYGGADPLDVARLLVTVADVSPAEALDAVTGAAGRVVGVPAQVVAGAPADLVVVDAADAADALARVPAGRTTLHGGRVVACRVLSEHDVLEGSVSV